MKTRLNLLSLGTLLTAVSTGLGQSTIQFRAAGYTVCESLGSVSVIVERVNALETTVSVDYTTADVTATNGSDYTPVAGTLTFASGETNQAIVVPILNGGLIEGTENFRVVLTNPGGGAVLGTRTNATVTITDNDEGVQFIWSSYSVSEGAGAAQVSVVRSDDGTLPLTVDFATSDLTAINGVDYTATTTRLAFAPGDEFKLVSVPLLNNSLKQPSRSFRVTLTNPVGASLGLQQTATVTIADDDQGFQFESATCTVSEDAGIVRVGVRRGTDDTDSAATVDCTTSDSSALNGLDYTGITNTVSFGPGETLQFVSVPILNNGTREGTESFRLTLSNPAGGVLGSPTTATVTIRDNDPGLGFEQARYTNAWGSTGKTALTILRGNDGTLGTVTVDYTTADGSAIAGTDYQATNGTLEFQENETVKALSLTLLRDRPAGGTRSFRVNLSNPTAGVVLGTASAMVDIVGAYVPLAPAFEPELAIRRESGLNTLTWAGGGRLQRADRPNGPWQTLATTQGLATVLSPVPAGFYRIKSPRPVSLYIPSSYDGHTPLPLVISLHGAGGTGAMLEAYVKLTPLAEARGFLYCYPDATPLVGSVTWWNAMFRNPTEATDYGYRWEDDLGFLSGLIEAVAQRLALDRKRVYLIGHSSGGMMSHWFACRCASSVAAIASLAAPPVLSYPPSEPVNILIIHGTADTGPLYYDDWCMSNPNTGVFPSALRQVQIWAGFNGATGPVTDPAPSMDLDSSLPGLDTVVTRYTNSPAGGAVELWTINGAGHSPALSASFSPAVMDWLLAHPKP